MNRTRTHTPTFYEFFAGGGMARAGLGSGWQCVFANDFDRRKGITYQANWGDGELLVDDIRRVGPDDLPGVADLVWGSFPCQDLSLAGGGAGLKGDRSGTFWPFIQIAHELKAEGRLPKVMALENVVGTLTSHGGTDFAAICRAMAGLGYRFGAIVVDAAHFVPQSRPRLFVIGVLGGHQAASTEGPTKWHTTALRRAHASLDQDLKDDWVWWDMPQPKRRDMRFADIIEEKPADVRWHTASETRDLYQSGLFRGAIERLRGQYAATMAPKREFVRRVLSFMQDGGFIADWTSAGEANRHDYTVTLNNGRTSVIELKGCLDGNNTNIFTRPPHAAEFVIWSICSNPGADPRHNVWSGIHTRLSAEIIDREQRVDGLVVWDWICGTLGRPCPKIAVPADMTQVAQYELTPPCIYLFPPTVPSPRNNPNPAPNRLQDVGILEAMHQCFRGQDAHLNYVNFEVQHRGVETERRTTITRGGVVVRQSAFTPIRRE